MRPQFWITSCSFISVSIHAPREGCDFLGGWDSDIDISVSIHAPREGCDAWCSLLSNCYIKFQFTHPGRGATWSFRSDGRVLIEFQFTHPGRGATYDTHLRGAGGEVSIHAPREGCDTDAHFWMRGLPQVSIHAPREGCDRLRDGSAFKAISFNSRTPGGVRHVVRPTKLVISMVSIHAPREGCDFYRRQDYEASHPVSIHAPREGCDYTKLSDDRVKRFQFTHPGRGATSVHTLQTSAKRSFNSRTPGGVRHFCPPWLRS